MSHYDEVVKQVDDAIATTSIQTMNELLVELGKDKTIEFPQRYEQQERLRTAIFHHGEKHR
ncbi:MULTISPECIES: DUF2526 family protein [Proteus]|uniref:DUF2526 family protein n=1 Tax=Proteus columbae TaxID=1987580 RepID=A0A6I7D7Z2_9GAMM|nr:MULTISPECIES: DUF2526 family protein [Proteus]MBG2709139.1 DUF2526 family protein [Proteus mirabilis]MBG2767503.1 DUF2526 family protein [Proteus mirabilis]MBG2801467.1 DUF2526 family protein [Proteus mirabilis]MBG3018386.1 DUF2526 family protein [Proteus mirabilis]MBI6542169.1 DUF2526 family protein [Proteus vulgaris]